MTNKIKKKDVIALAKEIDNDKEYWDRLEKMQEKLSTKWLKENIGPLVNSSVERQFSVDVNAIYMMDSLLQSDRFIMIYLLTQHQLGLTEVSLNQIIRATGYSRKGCGDILRRLVPMRLVTRTRMGWYQLNETKLF